jgi:hypothetical protein
MNNKKIHESKILKKDEYYDEKIMFYLKYTLQIQTAQIFTLKM